MKTNRIISMLAIVAAAVACNEPEIYKPSPMKGNQFNGSFSEAISKVSMDSEFKLSWEAGDRVSVFASDAVNYEFEAVSSGATSILTGPSDFVVEPSATYYAVYPYSEDNSISEGVITTVIPAEQTPSPGTLTENYAVAKSDQTTLSFYNLCGLMGFKITRSDIVKVTLAAAGEEEYLAGKITVDCATIPAPKYTVIEGSTEVSLVAENQFAPGDYYVALLPQTFSGMTITMYTADGQTGFTQSLGGFTLSRSHHIEPLAVDSGEFEEQALLGFPAIWNFTGDNFNTSWVDDNCVPANEGRGTFSYVTSEPINDKFKRDVSGGDPRVTGAWPGDYWLYEVPSKIPSKTKFSINFVGRVSDTGHKYWYLEYLDGQEWKPVGQVNVSFETESVVEYTHALRNADVPVGGEFTVNHDMTSLQVRYRCVANWQSKGGILSARNGGTVRMTGDNDAKLEIKVVETESDDADLVLSSYHVNLAAQANSTAGFTVKSSQPWTVSCNSDEYEITPSSGNAGEQVEVTVKTLKHNTAINLGRAQITVNSGDKSAVVELVQETEFVPMHVEWQFTAADATGAYEDTFNDTSKDAGDGGQYVAANLSGTGTIKYVQVDKNDIAILSTKAPARTVGGTGHPFVYGAWPGDYWLFEAQDENEYPAGTKLNITFLTRVHESGQKYWKLEYWDGEKWCPASDLQQVEVGGEQISYNFLPTDSTSNSRVDVTWELVKPCTVMQFRYMCVANYAYSGTVNDGLNAGTCRIAGAVGTSPVFKVVNE